MARYGCYLGLLAGLALAGYGLSILVSGTAQSLPFKLAFLAGGVLECVLCVHALRRSRVGWSFATALSGTAAVVFLFGAPKVRDGLEVSIALGFIPCLVFSVITVLLALGFEDYQP